MIEYQKHITINKKNAFAILWGRFYEQISKKYEQVIF